MIFYIEYDNQPKKFLKSAEKHIAERITKKIERTLSENPVPQDVKTIVGYPGLFRSRIGDYRVLYRINYKESKIIIIKIDKRERIY